MQSISRYKLRSLSVLKGIAVIVLCLFIVSNASIGWTKDVIRSCTLAPRTDLIKETERSFKSAKEALLKEAQALLDFLDGKSNRGVTKAIESPDANKGDAGKYNIMILAVGSPSPEAFVNAARRWREYKKWWGRDIPVVASTGRGRGAVPFIKNTQRYYRTNTKAAERFGELIKERGKELTEAEVIKFIFKEGGVPERAIYLEMQSTNTRENLEYSYDVIRNEVISKLGDKDKDKPLKIVVVADAFHHLRALLTTYQVYKMGGPNGKNKDKIEESWEINAEPFYQPDLSKELDDEKLFEGDPSYLEQWISADVKDKEGNVLDYGEIGRLKQYNLIGYDECGDIKKYINSQWSNKKLSKLRDLLKKCTDLKKDLNLLIRSEYRYVSLSMGGTKLAVSINDGNNNVLFHSELKWESEYPKPEYPDGVKSARPDAVIARVVKEIVNLLDKQKVGKGLINRVSANLAGPVNEEEGLFGDPFAPPNLPFPDKYKFRKVLQEALKQDGIKANVAMCNDAEGGVMGETYHPDGLLRDYPDGGIVIIGTGINIAVKKNGEVYFGPTGKEIKEGGHNLYQKEKDAQDNMHYTWSGELTKGGHPIEIGNEADEIIRKSGTRGKEYVKSPVVFRATWPDYPIIEWGHGMRDFEDRLSGPSIRGRLEDAIKQAKEENAKEKENYEKIEKEALRIKNEMEKKLPPGGRLEAKLVEALTPEADRGNKIAIKLIKDIGTEVGQALAAFIYAYKNEEFVKHLVLVSGVAENLGKGVKDDKREADDIFMKSVREGARKELIEYFGMASEKAEEIAAGIVRSNMTYERELVPYWPTDEEVFSAYISKGATTEASI